MAFVHYEHLSKVYDLTSNIWEEQLGDLSCKCVSGVTGEEGVQTAPGETLGRGDISSSQNFGKAIFMKNAIMLFHRTGNFMQIVIKHMVLNYLHLSNVMAN